MKMTFAEIAARRVRLTPAEAVALALAAAGQLRRRAVTAPLPSADQIGLTSAGEIVIFESDTTDGDQSDPVRWLAGLVHRLLTLETDAPGERRTPIPGGLLVLLARASGRIDLPQPSYAALLDGLARFGADDSRLLAALYWRCAGGEADPLEERPAATVLAWRGESRSVSPAGPPTHERRRLEPSVTDLRRDLRDAERRLFEKLQQARNPAPRRAARHVRTAAALLTGLAIGLGLAFLLVSERAPESKSTGSTTSDGTSAPIEARGVGPQTGGPQPDSSNTKPPQPPLAGTTAQDRPSRAVRADAFSPAFSAGGRELLFHTGRERAVLMRASLDGRGDVLTVSPLLQDGAANYHVTPSPDGHWIAYDSDRDGTRAVYVARPDASDARQVSGAGHAAVPTWSPDARRLAFVKAEPQRSRLWNIWLVDVDTGRLTRLTRHARGQPWGASWFPDGERIAYSLEDTLVIADLRDGTSRAVKSPRPGRLVRTPAVSPQGNRIVFQVYREGVWLFDVGTGAVRRILDDATAEEFTWSPDGRQVAYHARRNGVWSLWQSSIEPDGSASTAVAMLR